MTHVTARDRKQAADLSPLDKADLVLLPSFCWACTNIGVVAHSIIPDDVNSDDCLINFNLYKLFCLFTID